MKIQKISIIGAGCVGSFFARKFFDAGFEIVEIISRSKFSAIQLAHEVQAEARYEDFPHFNRSADLYILSVKDEVIMELRKNFEVGEKIIVHTSGSMPIEVFKKTAKHYGTLYPLQTIIKERDLDIAEIPFFIHASDDETRKALEEFAGKFAKTVVSLDDEKRIKLHMAAVFASNFTNYLLHIAEEILNEEGLDIDVLKPLVLETLDRAFDVGPYESQTGPAKRGDCNITDKHLEKLDQPEWKKLYAMLSELIREEYKKK